VLLDRLLPWQARAGQLVHHLKPHLLSNNVLVILENFNCLRDERDCYAIAWR